MSQIPGCVTAIASLLILCSLLSLADAHGHSNYRGFNDVHTMPMARSDMTATSFALTGKAHRMYLVGGCSSDQHCPPGKWCFCPTVTASCDYYTPDTDKWTTCADAPRARYRHAAVNLNNKLYLVGGRNVNDTVIQEVDVYDPATNTWETNPFVWTGAVSDLGAFVEGTKIYMIGGWDAAYTPVANLVAYAPATKTVKTLPSMPSGGRGDLRVISVPVNPNNPASKSYHYAVGGFATDACDPLSTVESFDVASNKWSTLANLKLPRGDLAIGVINGHMFAIAGETKDDTCKKDFSNPGNSIPVKDVERFDATVADANGVLSGAWVVEESVPGERFRFVASSYKRRIYLFGGQGPLDTTAHLHRLLNTTMLYVPKSVADSRKLEPEEIAGIIIAAFVLGGLCVCALLSYFSYQKYQGYVESKGTDPDDSGPVTEAGPEVGLPSKSEPIDETIKAEEPKVQV